MNYQIPEIEHDTNFINLFNSNTNIKYNYGDYVKFEFEELVELIRGKVYDNSESQNIRHHDIRLNLWMEIWGYLKGKGPQMYHGPFDVVLPIGNLKGRFATTVVQPDILTILDKTLIDSNFFSI